MRRNLVPDRVCLSTPMGFRCEEDKRWLAEVPREFRMYDNAKGVAKFIRHSQSTIYVCLVEYRDGTKAFRTLGVDIEWWPCCFLDKPLVYYPVYY